MENLDIISCQIIASSGTAKSCYMEALEAAKSGDYDQAQDLIKEADDTLLAGHRLHATLISESAANPFEIPLLLMHAEDQMMSCETIKLMALELIESGRKILTLEKAVAAMQVGCAA